MSTDDENASQADPTREDWLQSFQPIFENIRKRAKEQNVAPEEVAPEVVSETLMHAKKPLAVVHALIILGMIPIKLPPDFEP